MGEFGPRKIQSCASFKELFKVGSEVMPSTRKYVSVHFAKRICDGSECVVKVRMKPHCFRTDVDEKSWRRRTEFLLNLPLNENIGICRLIEVLEDNDGFYVVMERVRGYDLWEALNKQGAMAVDTVRNILKQLLLSVSHLHMHNIIHKDLKLENVMIVKEGRGRGSKTSSTGGKFQSDSPPAATIKIIDFDTCDEWFPQVSNSKDVVGTDQYIAQEAYAGKYSPLSDMFAIGVICFKLFTTKFPFNENIFTDKAGEMWAGSPHMTAIRKRIKLSEIDYKAYPVFKDQPLALDLVTRLLSYDEEKRPTAAVAL